MRAVLRGSRVGLAILALVLAAGTARGQELRTWKDGSGKFSIKAKFVSNEEGMLTLAKEDGEEVEIELKKLSEADQKFVADLEKAKSDPFKSKPDPFKSKKAGATKGRSSEGKGSEARAVNADVSDARIVTMVPEKGDWEVTVAAPGTLPTIKSRAVAVPAKSGFFERLKSLVVSADGKHAALGYTMDDPRPAGVTRLVVVDLEKGKTLGAYPSSGQMAPLAISDDGSQVLMKRDDFGFGNNDRLELWTVGGSGLSKGISFFPYGQAQGGDRDVKWGAYLAGDRALTVSNKGKLVLWELGSSAKAVYALDIQDGTRPALSVDRKLLAFTTGKEVGILDVEAGTVLGLKATPNTPFASLAFAPSGKKFAVVSMEKLWTFDTTTGNQLTETLLTGTFANGEVQWTGEDHVLVGHRFLIDLVNQVKLWQYNGAERAAQVGTSTLFLAENGHQSPGALVAAQIPQPAAKAALDKAITDPNFFVLKPGASVRIVVNDVTDASRRTEVTNALAQKLASIGAKVDPNGPLELVASTELGKQRDITYRTIGRGFGVQTYKVQEYISRVKFVYQGKAAWETSSYNIPHMISLKQGQTMESYLKEQEKPNYDFFSRVELPKLLNRPTGSPTLGTSTVSASGVR